MEQLFIECCGPAMVPKIDPNCDAVVPNELLAQRKHISRIRTSFPTVQYDNDSRDLTVQSRLRWIIEPGHDLFLVGVYGWNRERHAAPLIPTTQDVTLKVAYTVRF